MLEALGRGADLVLGSRYAPGGGSDGWPLHRRLASRFGCALSSRALGLPYTDLSGGFKLWRASALAAVDVASTRSQGYVFQVETTQRAHRAGLRVVELPFTFRDRTAGQSKMQPGDRARGRAHGGPPAPRRLDASARGVGGAHRRVIGVAHGVEALYRPQRERGAPLLAPRELVSAVRSDASELRVAADERDGRARHAPEPRDAAQGGQRGIGAQLEREHGRVDRRALHLAAGERASELRWLPVRDPVEGVGVDAELAQRLPRHAPSPRASRRR